MPAPIDPVRQADAHSALAAHLDLLAAEIGEPSRQEQARADAVARRILRHELDRRR